MSAFRRLDSPGPDVGQGGDRTTMAGGAVMHRGGIALGGRRKQGSSPMPASLGGLPSSLPGWPNRPHRYWTSGELYDFIHPECVYVNVSCTYIETLRTAQFCALFHTSCSICRRLYSGEILVFKMQ